jgi:hypothetical protein
MKPTLVGLATVAILAGCSRTEPLKRMTIRGTAYSGTSSKNAVSGGYVSLIVPAERGWQRIVFDADSNLPNIVSTNSGGGFVFTVEYNWWEEVFILEDRPVFLAVSDAKGDYTLLAPVPIDKVAEDASLTLFPSPETTITGLWQCPNGVFASPHHACPPNVVCQSASGFPCFQLPQQSKLTDSMVSAIDSVITTARLSEPTPGEWVDFSFEILDADPTLLDMIRQNLLAKGFTVDVTVTATLLSTNMALNPLLVVPKPTADDQNNGSTESPAGSGGSGGGGSGGTPSSGKCTSDSSCAAFGSRNCGGSSHAFCERDALCHCCQQSTASCMSCSTGCNTADAICWNGTCTWPAGGTTDQ